VIMEYFSQKDIAELIDITNMENYQKFILMQKSGIFIASEFAGQSETTAIKSEAGSFAKWIAKHHPNIQVGIEQQKPRLILNSGDIFLPLVFLASDVAFPIYLNIVSSYVYDMMRNSLRGEKTYVHFSVEFKDELQGKTKRFNFEGDTESLQKAIKRFDLNKFLDD